MSVGHQPHPQVDMSILQYQDGIETDILQTCRQEQSQIHAISQSAGHHFIGQSDALASFFIRRLLQSIRKSFFHQRLIDRLNLMSYIFLITTEVSTKITGTTELEQMFRSTFHDGSYTRMIRSNKRSQELRIAIRSMPLIICHECDGE